MNYKLAAFDLDGTLLTSSKTISEETLKAINLAADAGKYIILNTGRNPDEIRGLLKWIPKVRYINCVSGALVYDAWDQKEIFSSGLGSGIVKELFEISEKIDCMVHLHAHRSMMQKDKTDYLEHFYMGQYYILFTETAHLADNLRKEYLADPFPVYKFNMYCADLAWREKANEYVVRSGLPLEIAFAEKTSLECSPKGIHKGIGMMRLCEYLGIDISETIAAGDGGNDIMALKTAGLAVAMANADEEVKAAADVIVSDNDHDGCAEVIYDYLLRD